MRMGTRHSENLIKSPLITVFHISIWRECFSWRRGCFKLPLCCHYWKTYKKIHWIK